MTESNPRSEVIEELSENIAGKLTSNLLKRCSTNPNVGLFGNENDDGELPRLKNYLKQTIFEELLQSELMIREDWQNYLEWRAKQNRMKI